MLDMALTRARLSDTIAADYTTLARELILACPPPPDHRWDVPRHDELHWWCGDVVASTQYGASFFIRRSGGDDHDLDQLHVEVRWFWKDDGSGAHGRCNRHRAIVWCLRGPRIGGFRNLIELHDAFPKADTIEALAATVAATLRRIFES